VNVLVVGFVVQWPCRTGEFSLARAVRKLAGGNANPSLACMLSHLMKKCSEDFRAAEIEQY
jgi:hypothetical protein